VASDPEPLARFDREAKTLAALNHPNIAGIYGLERSDRLPPSWLRRYGATAFACWLLAAYPYLELDDITAALPFAARQNDHPVPRSA